MYFEKLIATELFRHCFVRKHQLHGQEAPNID